ncbi:MAG: AAA family ATPase [Anaerolineae bacterium]
MTEQVFVARERELSQLQSFLDTALAGHGQVCFVTGEAGAGKTALLTEFARRAQDAHADLLVAIGDCNAQTGIGDPYLPFREVLGLLTGDVEARLAQGAITQENAGRLWDFLCASGPVLGNLEPELIDSRYLDNGIFRVTCHCEERSDEAISAVAIRCQPLQAGDCFAPLAMTNVPLSRYLI